MIVVCHDGMIQLTEIIRSTTSLCPTCRRKIPATCVEEAGSVYMEKTCPEHGSFRPLIAKHADIYWDFMGLYDRLSCHFPNTRDKVESCAFTTTLRCNLKCPICFAGDENRVMPPEQTLEQIKEKLDAMRGHGAMFKIHGGEPTLREDLIEIIRLVRDSGNYPVMVTNAVKLEDFEYLKSLKDAGLYGLGPSFDSATDDRIYEQMRGRPLMDNRKTLMENVRKLGLKVIVFFVSLKGFNESGFPDVLKLTQQYPEIYKVIFLAYMHRGHRGFSEDNEYTTDETWEAIVRNTKAFDSIEDLYTAIRINVIARAIRNKYTCYNSQTVLMPRSENKDETYDFNHWRQIISRFESLLDENPQRAKRYFIRKMIADLIRKGFLWPMFQRMILRQKGLPDVFIPSKYHWLQFQTMYYPENYDVDMVKGFCPFLSFNPGVDKKISFCEYYALGLNT
jgi:uncharacterized radical SAM superfamily Fe-S cluster-containing enzyme